MADMYNVQAGQFGVQPPPNLTQMLGGASALTGGLAMQQNADYRNNMDMQNILNQMILQRNQQANTEFGANAPLRELQRAADSATARGTAATAEELAKTVLGEKQLSLRKGKATEQTDVAQSVSNAMKTIDTNNFEQQERDVERMFRETSSFDGPDALLKFSKWADDQGIPRNSAFRQQVESSRSAEEMRTKIKAARDTVINGIGQQRKLQEQAAKDTAHMERTQAEIAGRQKVAETNAAAIATKPGSRETEDQMEARYQGVINKIPESKDPGDYTADEREAVQWGVRTARAAWNAEVAKSGLKELAGAALIGGAMGQRAQAKIDAEEKKFYANQPAAIRKAAQAQLPADVKYIKDPKTGKLVKVTP